MGSYFPENTTLGAHGTPEKGISADQKRSLIRIFCLAHTVTTLSFYKIEEKISLHSLDRDDGSFIVLGRDK